MDFTWFLEISLIQLDKINKAFGTEIIFKDFSYTFPNDEKFLIKGPNGSGKTTLLEMLASIVIPCSGEITFDIDDYKFNLGFASSNIDSFFPELTGYENLEIFLNLRNKSSIDLNKKLQQYSELDLSFLNRKFLVYSKGMKQKLNLLRALIHDPLVLICDEPLEHLDASSRMFFAKKLSSYPHLTILSTHLIEFDSADFTILALKHDNA